VLLAELRNNREAIWSRNFLEVPSRIEVSVNSKSLGLTARLEDWSNILYGRGLEPREDILGAIQCRSRTDKLPPYREAPAGRKKEFRLETAVWVVAPNPFRLRCG